ncbi:MAG TPA: hypothetical protein PKW55_01930 [Spirochaetota bacterium]|nr:hypothetical protein [Spirochaetota bacterium]HOM38388.1 hypothetical protein [Spirochaetota bacterium]HPQ48394.1 hypothetical protein [Spirochaetota bacterium]
MKKIIVIFISLINILSCSSSKELSILDELTGIIKEAKNAEDATEKLKKFINIKKEIIKEIVNDFNSLELDKQMERYLEFNRKLYDKDGLFEIIETKNYNKDDNFNEVFEEFKSNLAPFFQKESKLGS